MHLNNHGHLLLDDVLIRKTGITTEVSNGVIEQYVGEVQVPIHPHGNSAVLPHSLHGGESCLDWPVEGSGIRT